MTGDIFRQGRIGVIPTDTIYGLVGSALIPDVVEQVYKLRKRDPNRPCIILISAKNDLKLFGIKLDNFANDFLTRNWPNPISVVLPCPNSKFAYLHRGTKTLAFRMPKDKKLLKFLEKSGPLVAPSANFEGQKSAETIEEAKKYFGDKIDFYLDNGKLSGLPSTLVTIKNKQIKVLRQGNFVLK